MNWFFIALVAPMIWGITNHLDKYVVARYAANQKPAALVVFSSLTAGIVALLIFCLNTLQPIPVSQVLWVIFAGMLFVALYIPYMYALQLGEVSVVAPLFQMIFPLTYILGVVFLNETLSLHQILASILVIGGAVMLTLNFKKLVWNQKVFELMLLSCLFGAVNTIIFKKIGLESSFWTASFWEYVGAFIFGLIILSLPKYRRDFLNFVERGRHTLVALNFLSETINVLGRVAFNSAILLAPVALVYVVGSTQSLFVILYSFILYIISPKIERENFSLAVIVPKLTAVILMILGSIILFF